MQVMAYFAKIDSSGTLSFDRKLTGGTGGIYNGVALDSSGNIYVGGTVSISNAQFGLAKYDSSGTLQWQEKINSGMFIKAHLRAGDANNTHFERFRQVRSVIDEKECTASEFVTEMPLMYYNNFFITSTAFWKQDNVQAIIDKIDDQKNDAIFKISNIIDSTRKINKDETFYDELTDLINRYSQHLPQVKPGSDIIGTGGIVEKFSDFNK